MNTTIFKTGGVIQNPQIGLNKMIFYVDPHSQDSPLDYRRKLMIPYANPNLRIYPKFNIDTYNGHLIQTNGTQIPPTEEKTVNGERVYIYRNLSIIPEYTLIHNGVDPNSPLYQSVYFRYIPYDDSVTRIDIYYGNAVGFGGVNNSYRNNYAKFNDEQILYINEDCEYIFLANMPNSDVDISKCKDLKNIKVLNFMNNPNIHGDVSSLYNTIDSIFYLGLAGTKVTGDGNALFNVAKERGLKNAVIYVWLNGTTVSLTVDGNDTVGIKSAFVYFDSNGDWVASEHVPDV